MRSLRRALAALAVLAFGVGLGVAALITTSKHLDSRGLATALVLAAGWGFAGTGLYAWDRRPGSGIGPLMTAIGFTWFLQGLQASNNSVVFAIGAILSDLPYAILVQLLLSFPSGRLQTRFQRLVVGAGYFTTIVLQLAWAFFVDPAKSGCEGCPQNPMLIDGHQGLAEAINVVQLAFALFAISATVAIVVGRWRRSSAAERRVLSPVVLTGVVAFTVLLAHLVLGQLAAPQATRDVSFVVAIAIFATLPFAFLLGLLRSRIGRAEEVSTALSAENAQLTAELEAKVEELHASRARIVEAGYAERRRVERDLHDGAQQRLMALTMNLKLARRKLDEDPTASAELLDEALVELDAATAELRELARGIHPAVLSDRGLRAALNGLAERSPVPVEVLEAPAERLPAPVETATYFVVAEALTNVARYAGAGAATVRVARSNGIVAVAVDDDGVGGADPEAGTGLRGLADRIGALDGTFAVRSEAGAGTTVEARIPCG